MIRGGAGLYNLEGMPILRRTALAAGAASLLPAASDRIRGAIIGAGGRGRYLTGEFKEIGVEMAAVCDVYEPNLQAGLKAASTGARSYDNYKKLLEDKSIDVVAVATPDHWHAQMTIDAVEAGKDVYVEKPGSHNVFEGRKMIEARDKYKRIVQHGVQLRSSEALRSVVDQMNKGVIGKVYMSRAIIYRWRPSVGKQGSQPTPPSHLNWDMWVGPAPVTQFSRKYHPYNWHWHWAFGNGDLGNQGVHELDMSLWGLGEQMPSEVTAMGGKFLWDDDKETPEVMTANYLFPSGKMLEVEVRHWCSNYEDEVSVGNIFYGSTGVVLVDGYNRYKIIKGGVNDIRQAGEWVEKGGDHFGNFISAVRSRKNEELHGPIETAHYSSAIAHLGNASYRLGRRLKFDVKTEQFVNDAEADQLITREYRAPYVVPKEV